MDQRYLFETIPEDKLNSLTKEELKILLRGEQDLVSQQQKYIEKLHNKLTSSEQKSFLLEEQTMNIKHRLFGRSSEKSEKKDKSKKAKKTPRKKILLPSDRYPNIDIIEKDVTLDKLPSCPCCNKEMSDSGLTEDSEYLTIIPKKYYVVKQKRHKYRCSGCHSSLVTTPAIPRIKPGSSFSDELVLDVSLSKYCDLIPVERYKKMAERSGVAGLPANTLIQMTHNLADFLTPIYKKIKDEVIASKVIHADETPHKMLEGDKSKNWFMWGFSSDKGAYFENQGTRSGDVAIDFLKGSNCDFLVSDVFSGYARAVRELNIYRKENNFNLAQTVYCNAHSRRKFKESLSSFEDESKIFLWCYKKIYRIDKLIKQEEIDFTKGREWQRSYFKYMEKMAVKIKTGNYSRKNSIMIAANYFYNNFEELSLFLKYKDVPIDNNSQERLMRSPVIGRKTWYGTHSKRGATTNAILFSLVESCKLNKINPREYFKEVVLSIHQNQGIFTPNEYLGFKSENIA